MISIVIPLYNKEQSIAATLDSVWAQTYTDFEVIIVDDGSTDGSAQVVQDWIKGLSHPDPLSPVGKDGNLSSPSRPIAPSPSIRVILQQNGGVCSARNRGICEAQGEYVAFLDADDQWNKDYLKEQMRMIADFPECAMWGLKFEEISEGKPFRELATGLPEGFRGVVRRESRDERRESRGERREVREERRESRVERREEVGEYYFKMQEECGRVSDLFCSSSVVIRKEVFERVGMFDERLKYSEDIDMWYRIIANYPVAYYDRPMCYYLYDAENRTMNRERLLKYWLPYYADKYNDPRFTHNTVFYHHIMLWCAVRIKDIYFSDSKQREDAIVASRRLDMTVLPVKYKWFFRLPYGIAKLLYLADEWRMNKKNKTR